LIVQVLSPDDLSILTETEFEELYETLKSSGIVLGDRSKIRRTTKLEVDRYRKKLNADNGGWCPI
jgi:phage pi2 protein 07